MSKKVTFVVRLELPAGAKREDARDYVEAAVRTLVEYLPESHPMIDLEQDTVRVTRLRNH